MELPRYLPWGLCGNAKGIKRSRGFFDRTCLIVELALAKRLRIVSETSRVKISQDNLIKT